MELPKPLKFPHHPQTSNDSLFAKKKKKGQRDFDAGIKQGSLLSRVNNISNITKHNASQITQQLFMRRFLNCSQFPADDLGAVTG